MMLSETDPEVIVAGHICLDILPVFDTHNSAEEIATPGKLVHIGPAIISVGGQVANTGLALYRLGIKTHLIGKVGDDLFGQAIVRLLNQTDESLSEQMLVDPGAQSSYSIIISPPGRDRTFLHYPGANDTFSASDILLEQATRGSIFHFGYPPLMRAVYSDGGTALATLLSMLKASGVTTSLDMALPDAEAESGRVNWVEWLRAVLPFVDIFAPSEEEIRYMLGYPKSTQPLDGEKLAEISTRLLDMGAALVALKLGEQGLYLRTTSDTRRLQQMGARAFKNWRAWQARELLCPCFCVEIAGTTGAGDCTIAGFLAALLRNEEPEGTLLTATAVGACSVEGSDATSGIPSLESVRQRIQEGWQQRTPGILLSDWRQLPQSALWSGPFDSQLSTHTKDSFN